MGPLLKGPSHSARSPRFALKSVRLRGVGATAHTSRAEDPAGCTSYLPSSSSSSKTQLREASGASEGNSSSLCSRSPSPSGAGKVRGEESWPGVNSSPQRNLPTLIFKWHFKPFMSLLLLKPCIQEVLFPPKLCKKHNSTTQCQFASCVLEKGCCLSPAARVAETLDVKWDKGHTHTGPSVTAYKRII